MVATDEPRSIPVNARDYFKEPTPAWKTHPLFRYWQGIKADPSVADVRMELYRPKEVLEAARVRVFGGGDPIGT